MRMRVGVGVVVVGGGECKIRGEEREGEKGG